jgi:hypothetical protein
MLLRLVLLLGAVLGGWAATAWAVDAAGVAVVEPAWRSRLVVVLTAGAAGVGAAVAVGARRRPRLAAEAGVVASGVLLGAAGTAALHGTRWGWYGLFADASFRTQMATRYAETPALVDYGYRACARILPLAWVVQGLGSQQVTRPWRGADGGRSRLQLLGRRVWCRGFRLSCGGGRVRRSRLPVGPRWPRVTSVWPRTRTADEWLRAGLPAAVVAAAVRDVNAATAGVARLSLAPTRSDVVLGLLPRSGTRTGSCQRAGSCDAALALVLRARARELTRATTPAPRRRLRGTSPSRRDGLAVSAVSWLPWCVAGCGSTLKRTGSPAAAGYPAATARP